MRINWLIKLFLCFFVTSTINSHIYQMNHEEYLNNTISKRPLRVLSIDGGGIRGILPLTYLCDIEAGYNIKDGQVQRPTSIRKPVNLTEEFDVFIGTSTGAIIAAALAQGMKAREILELYTGETRKEIFSRHMPFGMGKLIGTISDVFFTSKYSSAGLAQIIHRRFNMRISRTKKPLLITATELKEEGGYELVIFDSVKAQRSPTEYDVNICDALRASTAAPTFFPEHRMIHTSGSFWKNKRFIDGGVMCNSPAWKGVNIIAKHLSHIPDVFKKIKVLSLGTCTMKGYDEHDHWNGKISWAQPAISAMFSAQASSVDENLKAHLKGNYLRWDVNRFSSLTDFIALDDISEEAVELLMTMHNVDGFYKIDQLRKFLDL